MGVPDGEPIWEAVGAALCGVFLFHHSPTSFDQNLATALRLLQQIEHIILWALDYASSLIHIDLAEDLSPQNMVSPMQQANHNMQWPFDYLLLDVG